MKAKATIAVAALAALVLLSGMAAADGRASITTDKATYAVGETVTMNILNEGDEPIQLNGFWVEDDEECRIYTSEVLCPMYLAPGESHRYSWAQVTDGGSQVREGRYTVNIELASAAIEIAGEDVDITTDKETYDAGEDVVITLTNGGEDIVYVPGGYSILDEKGGLVYAENSLACMVALQSGESVQYVWTQTDGDGNKVAAGNYTVCAADVEAAISIATEPAAEDRLWNGQEGGGQAGEILEDLPVKKPVPAPRKTVSMI
jgi:hypothetical protein